jgi:hypothetical protein
MYNGLAIVLGNISNQREQLHLLLQINRSLILLCLRVEPRKLHRSERADSLEARIGKVVLRRKVPEPFCKLVPRIENKDIASSVDLSPSHGIAPTVLDVAKKQLQNMDCGSNFKLTHYPDTEKWRKMVQ